MASKDGKGKAERVPAKWAEAARDIDALAAFAPRARAIELLLAGRVKDALDWLAGDGYFAAHGQARPKENFGQVQRLSLLLDPFEVDSVLSFDRVPAGADEFVAKRAIGKVDCYAMSPVEIILRRGSPQAFKAALAALSTPQVKKLASFNGIPAIWLSRHLRKWAAGPGFRQPRPSNDAGHELLALAAMLGKFEQAEMMIKAGFAPDSPYKWGKLLDLCREVAKASAEDRSAVFGIEAGVAVEAGLDWINAKDNLCSELEKICSDQVDSVEAAAPKNRALTIAMLRDVLAKGASAGCFALSIATQWNEVALLREMFAAGANPNCLYKSGVPILGQMQPEKLSSEALQAWLDAGADAAFSSRIETALGDGGVPSGLYSWANAGRLDLMRQAAEHSRGPVKLKYTWRDKTYSPLLAVALSRGRLEMADWLVKEHGNRMDHFDVDGETRCSSFA